MGADLTDAYHKSWHTCQTFNCLHVAGVLLSALYIPIPMPNTSRAQSQFRNIFGHFIINSSPKHSHQTANGIAIFCLLSICSTSCNSPRSSEDHQESQTLTIIFQQEHQQRLYSLWLSTSIFHTCPSGAKEHTATCNLGGKPLPSAMQSLHPLKEIYR